jgi:hypothetical protein
MLPADKPAGYSLVMSCELVVAISENWHVITADKAVDKQTTAQFLIPALHFQQAKAVQQHIKAAGIRVDVVLVSPLTRALETAVGCFGNLNGPSNGTAPLMIGLTEVPGRCSAHPAVGAEGSPPFVCYELCRWASALRMSQDLQSMCRFKAVANSACV